MPLDLPLDIHDHHHQYTYLEWTDGFLLVRTQSNSKLETINAELASNSLLCQAEAVRMLENTSTKRGPCRRQAHHPRLRWVRARETAEVAHIIYAGACLTFN